MQSVSDYPRELRRSSKNWMSRASCSRPRGSSSRATDDPATWQDVVSLHRRTVVHLERLLDAVERALEEDGGNATLVRESASLARAVTCLVAEQRAREKMLQQRSRELSRADIIAYSSGIVKSARTKDTCRIARPRRRMLGQPPVIASRRSHCPGSTFRPCHVSPVRPGFHETPSWPRRGAAARTRDQLARARRGESTAAVRHRASARNVPNPVQSINLSLVGHRDVDERSTDGYRIGTQGDQREGLHNASTRN